jgi:hypothetical protein
MQMATQTKAMSVIRKDSKVNPSTAKPRQIKLIGDPNGDLRSITADPGQTDQYFPANMTATLNISQTEVEDLAKALGDATVQLHVEIDFDDTGVAVGGANPITDDRISKIPSGTSILLRKIESIDKKLDHISHSIAKAHERFDKLERQRG